MHHLLLVCAKRDPRRSTTHPPIADLSSRVVVGVGWRDEPVTQVTNGKDGSSYVVAGLP